MLFMPEKWIHALISRRLDYCNALFTLTLIIFHQL